MTNPRNANPHAELDPELRSTATDLQQLADQITPDPRFIAGLEHRLLSSHPGSESVHMFSIKKLAPAVLWALAALATTVVVYWTIRSLAPAPVPAAHNTPVVTGIAPVLPVDQSTPVPSEKSYDWNGTTLTLGTELPASPAEAAVYLGQAAEHATLEQALALAEQFGIHGSAYSVSGEVPGTSDFLITDGKQSLRVRSAGYYSYTADMIKSFNNMSAVQRPDATVLITDFLTAHGITFPYRVEWTDYRSGYLVEPLSPDGTPYRYENYSAPMLFVTLQPDGHIATLQASLLNIPSEPVGRYAIISADDAFARILSPSGGETLLESFQGPPALLHQWARSYPVDQDLTIYGYASAMSSVQAGQPAFIQIDGFPVTGAVSGLEALSSSNNYVTASGRFVVENGIQHFQVASWSLSDVPEDGVFGTLDREGGLVIFKAQDGATLTMPDVPADVPMPFNNAFVVGARRGDVFEWKLIDDRPQSGGGGGGGGGIGFYKLNLTGTPMPFPTATPATVTDGAGLEGAVYVVKPNDTLSGIASQFGVTVEALMQANNLTDPNAITVGQTLAIRGGTPERIEALRGMLNITISKLPDGSQSIAYGFMPNASSNPSGYMLLDGPGLEALQAYNGRPVDVWGTMDVPQSTPIPTIKVERFELPFPDLKIQVLQGTQTLTDIAGQPATLFRTDDGQTYVQLLADGITGSSLIGKQGDEVQIECVAVPGETLGGYPALHIFGGMLAIDPKTGQHINLPITADKPHVMDMPSIGKPAEAPTATIETVELVHFTSDMRYAGALPGAQPPYLQPVWRFTGHYSNGDEFEILVQALQQQYLLPELAPAVAPG